MTGKLVMRLALLSAVLALTAMAGQITLGFPGSGQFGDAAISPTGTYTDVMGGDHIAHIVIGGNIDASGAVAPGAWPTNIGLSLAALNAIAGVGCDVSQLPADPCAAPVTPIPLEVGNGSAVWWNIEAEGGDYISRWVNFVANDSIDFGSAGFYDDFAFFWVSNGTTTTYDVLGRIDVLKGGVGNFGSTGPFLFQHAFTGTEADYTVGFGVVNVGPAGDSTFSDSALLLDTPEPSSLLLAGPALLLAGLWKRRRA